jgi:hypothetical protein
MVLREGLVASIDNAVVSGFDAGADIRDDSEIEMTNSSMFESVEETVGYAEEDDCDENVEPDCDDDNGIDETAWFEDGDGNNHD